MNLEYIYYLLLSFVSSLIFMPMGFKIIQKFNIIDKPNHRKIHKKEILSGGGIVIFVGVLISFIFISYQYLETMNQAINVKGLFIYFMIGFSILFLMGLFDDRLNLKAKSKFFFQIIACLLFILLSDQFISFDFIFKNKVISILMTLFFMLSVINAFNLIDGLDGLATGLSLISLISLSLVSYESMNYMIYPLVGAILAFMIKNSYPAKVFLGDSGSYILGYSLSVFIILAINLHPEIKGTFKISYMLLFISIPVIDVFYAFFRRIINRVNVFSADRKHLHHQLLNRGIKHKDAVFILYLIHALFSLIGLILLNVYLSNVLLLLFIPFLYFIYVVFRLSKLYDCSHLAIRGKSLFKYFNNSVFFLLIPMVLSININVISNSRFLNDYYLIVFLILMANCVFVVSRNFKNDIPTLFCGAIFALVSFDFYAEDSWVNIFNSYIYYFMAIILLIYILINIEKIKFHPLFFLALFFIIIFSSMYGLELHHLINFIVLLGGYKVLLEDNIIKKYRLLHLVNIITLLIILCT